MTNIKFHRHPQESVANFKRDILGIAQDLRDKGANITRAGIGKNTAQIRVIR